MTTEGPLNVFHLITGLKQGGSQELLYSIINNSPENEVNHNVGTIGPRIVGAENTLKDKIEDAGAIVTNFEANCRIDPKALSKIYTYLNTKNVDVLHAHSVDANIIGRVIGRIAGINGIVSTHHIIPSQYHPILQAPDAITTTIDSKTIAVSKGVKKHFFGYNHEFFPSFDRQWEVIYNGINISEFRKNIKNADTSDIRDEFDLGDELVYLNVGRYESVKRQRNIIKAFDSMAESNSKLFIVGSGSLEKELLELVNELDLQERVYITGHVEDIYKYYSVSDVFVSASVREGLPLTHLEAMSAGLPIISTEIPGVTEVVTDDKNGILVPPDSIPDLSSAMSNIQSYSNRQEYIKMGRETVETKFDINNTVEEYLKIYRSIS